jgi:hypothetical protein
LAKLNLQEQFKSFAAATLIVDNFTVALCIVENRFVWLLFKILRIP